MFKQKNIIMIRKFHDNPYEEKVRKLELEVIDLQNRLEKMEKKGVALRVCDYFSISFLSTITSALIVLSLVLLIFLKIKLL